jgi:hypothetical protein
MQRPIGVAVPVGFENSVLRELGDDALAPSEPPSAKLVDAAA